MRNSDVFRTKSEETLQALGFRRPIDVSRAKTIANRVGRTVRCGVYVLEFSDGTWYVGQAVDFTRRFRDHKKRWNNIVRVHFKRVPKRRLDEAERGMIGELEKRGWLLHNVSMASYPRGAAAIEDVLDRVTLNSWSRSVTTFLADAKRKNLESHRLKHRGKFERYQFMPLANGVNAILHAYADVAIPCPRLTEMDFWSVTCLPNGPEDDRIMARVNLYWQEVLVLGNSRGVFGKGVWAAFQVARTSLPQDPFQRLAFRFRHPFLIGSDFHYATGGSDQVRWIVFGEKRIRRLLADPVAILAIRALNVRLMRKGRSNAAASHCVDLADVMLTGR